MARNSDKAAREILSGFGTSESDESLLASIDEFQAETRRQRRADEIEQRRRHAMGRKDPRQREELMSRLPNPKKAKKKAAKKKSTLKSKAKKAGRKIKKVAKTDVGRAGIGGGIGALALGPIGAVAGAVYAVSTQKKKRKKSKNPARAFTLETQLSKGRQKKAKAAAGRASRSSAVASEVSASSLRSRLAKINPGHYEEEIPGMTAKGLDQEHVALTALIKRAERLPETSGMARDLRDLRTKIVAEKSRRRKSNPLASGRKVYTPSADELRLIKKYGAMKVLEGRSPRAIEAAIKKLRETEAKESVVVSDSVLSKYAKVYRRKRAAHLNLVTSPGSSPGAIARAKKQLDDAERKLILYAEIRNMDPVDLQRFMAHAEKKRKAAAKKRKPNPGFYAFDPNSPDAERHRALVAEIPHLGTLGSYPRGAHMWESVYIDARVGGASKAKAKAKAWKAVREAGYYEDSKGAWRMPRRRFNPGSHPKENPLKTVPRSASARQARTTISKNIATEMAAGRPQRQAVAIALASARRDAPKLIDGMYGPRPNPSTTTYREFAHWLGTSEAAKSADKTSLSKEERLGSLVEACDSERYGPCSPDEFRKAKAIIMRQKNPYLGDAISRAKKKKEAEARKRRRTPPPIPASARRRRKSKSSHTVAATNPRKTKPEWKRLIDRCQKLWDTYCEKPTKKNLRLVLAHIEKMGESTSSKVKKERSACLRVAKKEAKRLKLK